MKAIGAPRFLPVTHPDCLVEFETPDPTPGPNDVLVKVHAVAINPVDTKVRKLLGDSPQTTPRILGWDAAGTVIRVGSAVNAFAPGDEIYYAGDVTRPGSNSELHCVEAALAAKKPTTLTFADAAALPLVTITAWELLFERMGVDPHGRDSGKHLLILNGAGGVGSALIPLAKSAGLIVTATASRPETRAWCTSLGADHLFDHHQPLRPQAEALRIREFPFIANLHNTETYWQTTSDLLAPLGTLGLIVETQNPVDIGNPLRLKSPRIVWEYMFTRSRMQTPCRHHQGEILARIATRCDLGNFPKLTTRTLSGLTVQNLITAHTAMESATAHGKWVITT
jgi:zinc-binding alcohol dehydrogenase family protein